MKKIVVVLMHIEDKVNVLVVVTLEREIIEREG